MVATNATGEAETGPLRLQFDRSVKLTFEGASLSSDGGLLLHRELDDALGLTDMAAALLADPRTGRNGRRRLAGLLRQSIFSRLVGYEDVNDADRLRHDPVMRRLVGGRAVARGAASASGAVDWTGFGLIAGVGGRKLVATDTTGESQMDEARNPDLITIKEAAIRLDRDVSHIFKVVKKLGLPISRVRKGTGRQTLQAISASDFDHLQHHLGEKRHGAYVANIIENYSGYLYVIQLEPDHDPNRFKVGHAIDVSERLKQHRTSAPFSKLVESWPCKLLWEKTAIDCLTHDCEQIYTEVFRAPEGLDKIVQRARNFFELMPDAFQSRVEENE